MKIKKYHKLVIILCVLLIIILLLVIKNTTTNNKNKYKDLSKEELDAAIDEKIEKINKIDLAKLSERDRIQTYVGFFITAIENKEYETAYQMLYSEFRDNYFPGISDFEEYAKTKFPSMMSMDYVNIERNGNVYVLWVTLSNPISGKKSEKDLNFVVRENELNDFDLSFSVF